MTKHHGDFTKTFPIRSGFLPANSLPPPPLYFSSNFKGLTRFFEHLHFFASFSAFGLFKTLFVLSLCFFLGACLGGGDSSSSNSNSASEPKESEPEEEKCSIENGVAEFKGGKCVVVSCSEGYYKPIEGDTCLEGGEKRHRPCEIEKGQGELTWSPKKGAWNDECQLISCNAGYDDQDNDNDCEKTIAGYYSTAGSKNRQPCTGKPDHLSWTSSTGLKNANECEWACDAGYDDHKKLGTCSVTVAEYYSLAGNSKRIACSTVTNPDDATADTSSTGLSSPNECWTCNAGYDDHGDTGSCSVTAAEYYSPAGRSARIACSTVTNPDDATADISSTGLSSPNECWTCNAGYDDHGDTGSCSVTAAEYYSPAGRSARIACSTVTIPDKATADTSSTELSSPNECWTCNASLGELSPVLLISAVASSGLVTVLQAMRALLPAGE